MNEPLVYNFLDDDELLRISHRIKEVEKITSGEVCVSIKEKRSFFEKKKSVKELAEEEFVRLGITETKDKTGILIFILLADKKFYILADEGINEKVSPDTWENIKNKMQQMFQRGEFSKGILHGIDLVGEILSKYFPIKPGDTNELSNKVVVR